jgi:hypothetical protein
MFLNFLKYRHFIGQSEHVFKKNVFFIVAPTGESWSENLVKNAYLLPRNVWKKTLSFAYNYTPRRTPGTNKFIFQMRRFLRRLTLVVAWVPTIRVQLYENRFFLPGIHQKYSSSSKCVDNHDIRMNKHKNLTFRLILRKKIGSIKIRTHQKITFRFISGEPDVKST